MYINIFFYYVYKYIPDKVEPWVYIEYTTINQSYSYLFKKIIQRTKELGTKFNEYEKLLKHHRASLNPESTIQILNQRFKFSQLLWSVIQDLNRW